MSPVVFVLRFGQLAGHEQPGGGFDVGPAAGHGLGVLLREAPQHPVGQVVVGAGLFAHPDADAGERVGPQPGNDALEAVVAPCRPGRPDAQLAGGLGDVVAQDDDVIGRDLEKGGQGGDGVPRKVHIGKGLEQADLAAVHFALAPQALELAFGDRNAPLAGQVVQSGKAGVVAGALVFGLGVAEAGDQPDVVRCHSISCSYGVCKNAGRAKRNGPYTVMPAHSLSLPAASC